MVKQYLVKLILSGSLLALAVFAKAQHDPYFTHFRFVQQAYNPAAAGLKEDYICLSGLTHYQYRQYNDRTFVTGSEIDPAGKVVTNVAPETYNFNLNTLLKLDKKGRHKMGVGITFLDDKVGYMKTTTYKAALNYRLPIQGNFGYLAIGLEVGATAFGYEDPKFKFLDPNDPHIPITGGSKSNPDLGLGIYYSQKTFLKKLSDFYLGVSYNHLNAANYAFQVQMANGQFGNVDMDFVRYLHINTGADWKLNNPNWVLEPAILIKYNPKFQLDLSMTGLFSNTIRVGLGYRTAADALSVIAGYQRGQLQIGYSYDITMSQVRKVSDGTHEIFVKYCFPINFPPPPTKIPRLSPRFLGRGAY